MMRRPLDMMKRAGFFTSQGLPGALRPSNGARRWLQPRGVQEDDALRLRLLLPASGGARPAPGSASEGHLQIQARRPKT